MHNVDATKMANIFLFKFMLFDPVVYNFPHAGFFPDEKRVDQIWLVDSFFKQLLSIDFFHIAYIPNSYMRVFLLYYCFFLQPKSKAGTAVLRKC